jgi:hypothetical protein
LSISVYGPCQVELRASLRCCTGLVWRRFRRRFFDEFTQPLGYLSSFAAPYVVTGDLNICLDRTSHPLFVRFNDLLVVFDAIQLVDEPTHDGGDNLDVVITRADLWSQQAITSCHSN